MQLSGLKAHRWQRISALYLLVYFSYLAVTVFFTQPPVLPNESFQQWLNPAITPLFVFLSATALLLTLIHGWVGGRDIIIDYIPRARLRLWLGGYLALLWLTALDILWLSSQLL